MVRMTSIWAHQRERWFGSPHRNQGLLVSRDLLTSVGGYVALPLVEDFAVAQRLKGRLNPLPFTLATGATRYGKSG